MRGPGWCLGRWCPGPQSAEIASPKPADLRMQSTDQVGRDNPDRERLRGSPRLIARHAGDLSVDAVGQLEHRQRRLVPGWVDQPERGGAEPGADRLLQVGVTG